MKCLIFSPVLKTKQVLLCSFGGCNDMDTDEVSEFCNQYGVTGSQSEIPDVPFSPGSQDSLSNIRLDFEPDIRNPTTSSDLPSEDLDDSQLTYRLNVSFESQATPVAKSTAWTYSELSKRLYVNISQPCPIRVKLEPQVFPCTTLRCFLRYQKADYVGDPVTQCANHAAQENNLSLRGHVLRCKHNGVEYKKDEDLRRFCLCVPLDKIQGGPDQDMLVFEFKCLTTCLGRRTMELVFQVEHSGHIICCQCVSVRICSCPGRDRRHDEDIIRNHGLPACRVKMEKRMGPTKRPLVDDGVYTIRVTGRKNYEILEALKQRLEMADAHEREQAEVDKDSSEKSSARETIKEPTKASHQFSGESSSYHNFSHRQTLQQPQSGSQKRKIRKTKASFTVVKEVFTCHSNRSTD